MRSITTQKKAMWLPLANYANILLFVFNCHKSINNAHTLFMLFVYFGGWFGIGTAIHILLSLLLPEESFILFGYTFYLFPVLINWGLIKYQEKYFPS